MADAQLSFEHLPVVLADQWSWPAIDRRCLRHLERGILEGPGTQHRMFHLYVHFSISQLWIVLYLVLATLDRHGPHSRRLAPLHDLVLAQGIRPRLNPVVHFLLVLQATLEGVKFPVRSPGGASHYIYQSPPLLVGEAGDGTPVVVPSGAGPVGVVRCRSPAPVIVYNGRARPVTSVTWRVTLSNCCTPVGLDVQEHRAVERHSAGPLGFVDVLPPASDVAVMQGAQGIYSTIHTARIVQVRPPPTGGRFAWQSGQVRHTRQRLGNGPHSLIFPVPPRMPEPGHREVDDVGPELFHILVAEPPPLQDPISKVLYDDV